METLHAVFSIGGPLVTLVGVAVSVLGTFLLTKWYHPYTEEGFLDHLMDTPLFVMAVLHKKNEPIPGEEIQRPERPTEAEKKLYDLERISRIAEVNKERRAVSLVGVDLLFIGFVLQGVGAVSSLIDVSWVHIFGR